MRVARIRQHQPSHLLWGGGGGLRPAVYPPPPRVSVMVGASVCAPPSQTNNTPPPPCVLGQATHTIHFSTLRPVRPSGSTDRQPRLAFLARPPPLPQGRIRTQRSSPPPPPPAPPFRVGCTVFPPAPLFCVFRGTVLMKKTFLRLRHPQLSDFRWVTPPPSSALLRPSPPLLCSTASLPLPPPQVTPPPPGHRHGQQPVSGTADPRSSQTGQVIRGLR